jgi:hypothetical protein
MKQDDRRMRSRRERHAVEILDRLSIRLELSMLNFNSMNFDRAGWSMCRRRNLRGWLGGIAVGGRGADRRCKAEEKRKTKREPQPRPRDGQRASATRAQAHGAARIGER